MLGKGKEKWVEVRDLDSCKLLGWLYLAFRSGFEEFGYFAWCCS